MNYRVIHWHKVQTHLSITKYQQDITEVFDIEFWHVYEGFTDERCGVYLSERGKAQVRGNSTAHFEINAIKNRFVDFLVDRWKYSLQQDS